MIYSTQQYTHLSCSAGRRAGFSTCMSTCSLIQSDSTVKSPSAFMAAFSLRDRVPLFFEPEALSVRSPRMLPVVRAVPGFIY